MLPTGYTAFWHDANKPPTNNVIEAIFLLLPVWQTDNSEL
jgi:hypothetical protein